LDQQKATSPLVENLNPQQAEAVTHLGSPMLIIAGAGSGKTRVITHRIAYLTLEIGIPLWQILAVTFTNKAAAEMRNRVCRILGRPNDPSLAISTFHSRCVAILRREAEHIGYDNNFVILDDRDQLAAIKKAMDDLGIKHKTVKPPQVQQFINLAKMKLLTPEEADRELDESDIPYTRLYKKYQEILQQNESLDFEDLIFKTVRLFQENKTVLQRWQEKYRFLLIDEFQDTNYSQLELVKLLTGPKNELCVVGDEDQSIYSWRGADVNNILNFQDMFENVKLVRLEQNYRSDGNILKAAEAVIENNTMRIGKNLWTEKGDGDMLRGIAGMDDREEAEQVASTISKMISVDEINPSEIAIFYRSNRLSRAIEDAIRQHHIPYRVFGGVRFYDRAEIKDMICYLRLAVNPHHDLSFERVVNVPTRGVGAKTLSNIVARAQKEGATNYIAAKKMLEADEIKGKAKKGLAEFLQLLDQWHGYTKNQLPSMVMKKVRHESRYVEDHIGDIDSLDGRSRIENMDEFQKVIEEYEQENGSPTLPQFLADMALDSPTEKKPGPCVNLMTIHNAKGLEFDTVFIVGCEDGLFPNSRTQKDPEQFEEERRLFYVALTRARKKLYLCRACRRMQEGFYNDSEASTFLLELPEDLLSTEDQMKLGITSSQANWRNDPFSGNNFKPFGRDYTKRAFGKSSTDRNKNLKQRGRGSKSLEVGDRVEHNILGPGIITEKGGRSGSERVYVEFDDGREQEFVVRFAPLKKIEE